jgi:acylphosphatase
MNGDIIQRLTIEGRVQGVGYRAFVVHTAERLGLEGWVRNRRDGSVEAVIAGPAEDIAKLIVECRLGPSAARVESVDVEPATAEELALRTVGTGVAVLDTL